MSAMPVEDHRDFLALWAKQEEVGGTPCMENPTAWDPPTHYRREDRKAARILAQRCLDCPALAECRVVAMNNPDIRGVIAGQVRYPKAVGRRPNPKKQENKK